MKGLFGACAAVAATTFLTSGIAQAQVILVQRCNVDSLDPAQAEKRINWARRCALDMNVGSPGNGWDTGMAASNGGALIDYTEPVLDVFSGQNGYTGNSDNLDVNYVASSNLYRQGATAQSLDFRNFYQWARTVDRKKARPFYPTFGSLSDINNPNNKQLFPNLNNDPSDCGFFTDAARGGRYVTNADPGVATGKFYVNGYCEASCYTPEQEILFSDGYAPILDAVNARRADMVTLTPDSSLDNIQLMTGRTYSYTAEFRDSTHPIVEIKTASGGLLRVTTEHPIVNGEGRLVTAEQLKVGDELVKADGTPDPIVGLNRTEHYGKVYNLRPNTEDRVSNLLVAGGYVVGSSLFQNDEVGYLNRIILNGRVPAEVIP